MSSTDRPALRVVLVEDDESLRTLVAAQLADLDVDVVSCDPRDDDPHVCVTSARPDAVVLDWRMPGISGLDLCARLREDARCDDVAIVFLTGLSDHRDRHRARAAGADAFLVKGVDADSLATTVRRAVAERRDRQARAR